MLSDADLAALRATARDLSDIPADVRRRHAEGMRRAYDTAAAICRGERDPLCS